MKSIRIAILVGSLALASPALADHPGNLGIPYASRGECESVMAGLAADDHFWLTEAFPWYFETTGDAASFLTRAFSCDRNESDGQWYFSDHRVEVLESDWFLRRQ